MGLDSREILQEEPTSEEVADALTEVLDSEICDEIRRTEDINDALELAFTAMYAIGKDPEEFLKEKGILE